MKHRARREILSRERYYLLDLLIAFEYKILADYSPSVRNGAARRVGRQCVKGGVALPRTLELLAREERNDNCTYSRVTRGRNSNNKNLSRNAHLPESLRKSPGTRNSTRERWTGVLTTDRARLQSTIGIILSQFMVSRNHSLAPGKVNRVSTTAFGWTLTADGMRFRNRTGIRLYILRDFLFVV